MNEEKIPVCMGGFGNIWGKQYKQGKRIYSSETVCIALSTQNEINACGGNPYYMIKERFFRQALETLESNEVKPGDTINAFNKSVDRSGCSPTITTRVEGFKTAVLPVVEDKIMEKAEEVKTEQVKKPKYAIRKLTENETWRLMGFSDKDFNAARDSGVSRTQLYRQAGNSIVRQVLMAIFLQMGIQGKPRWNDMSIEERQKMVDDSLDFLKETK